MKKLVLAIAVTIACGSAHSKAGKNMASPLTDLNIARDAIPAILLEAKKAPYAAPAERSCEALQAQVLKLTEALGPDYDTPVERDSDGNRLASAAGDAAVGAVGRTVEGAIPFYSWLRKLSGAERHAREVAEAITAGSVRRGFLRGMATALSCPARELTPPRDTPPSATPPNTAPASDTPATPAPSDPAAGK